jgi:hypothetical protein
MNFIARDKKLLWAINLDLISYPVSQHADPGHAYPYWNDVAVYEGCERLYAQGLVILRGATLRYEITDYGRTKL